MALCLSACGGAEKSDAGASPETAAPVSPWIPSQRISGSGEIRLGMPVALAIDFDGRMYIGDASPGRVVSLTLTPHPALEFQQPTDSPGFYPSDVAVRGFFVYAVDRTSRRLLRFDSSGGYRDILIDFTQLVKGRRLSPAGLSVDDTGVIAVTDIENHQVLVINNYLRVDVAFGAYGSFDGQFDDPRGVSFTRDRELLVADTGNRRLQRFTATGTFLRAFPGEKDANPLVRPRRAVEDADGNVIVADPGAGAVFWFSSTGALKGAFAADVSPRFEPTDVVVMRTGRILVSCAASRAIYAFEGF